jgi:hypothetical protein
MCPNQSEKILEVLSSENILTRDLQRQVLSYLPLPPLRRQWGRDLQTESFLRKIPETTKDNLKYGKKTYIEEYFQVQHGLIENRWQTHYIWGLPWNKEIPKTVWNKKRKLNRTISATTNNLKEKKVRFAEPN